MAVLERAGLVAKERRGPEQLVRSDPEGVARARRSLDELEALWRGRIARMTEMRAEEPAPRGSQGNTRRRRNR